MRYAKKLLVKLFAKLGFRIQRISSGRLNENIHYVMDVDVLSRIALEKPPL